MTAILIAYFLWYGTHIKKALRGYVTIAVMLIAFTQIGWPNMAYAQSTGHNAAISSISDEDIEAALEDDEEETEASTGSTTTGDVSSGSTTEDDAEAKIYNDSDGSVVDALNDLLDLKSVYAKLDAFKGNNTEFYELLRDWLVGYTTAGQAAKFVSIVDKLDILDDETYALYGLNKAGIMDVLPEMADEQRYLITAGWSIIKSVKKKWESINIEMLKLEYELFYGAKKPAAGLPIVFHMDVEGATNIKRAVRRFGNWRVYTCKWNQCDRVAVTYSEEGTYEIKISYKYANGETWRHIFEVDVDEEMVKKARDSDAERVIVDVMKNKTKSSADEVEKTSTVKTEEEDESDESIKEQVEEVIATDDEELDDAFESLLVSIFGE